MKLIAYHDPYASGPSSWLERLFSWATAEVRAQRIADMLTCALIWAATLWLLTVGASLAYVIGRVL